MALLFVYPVPIDPEIMALAMDKQRHYEGGRSISTAVFLGGYLLLAFWILFRGKGPLALRLLWLPTSYACLGGVAVVLVALLAGGKELVDALGAGSVEYADFITSVDGAWVPHVGGVLSVLGLTPILIPLDILMQWPAFQCQEKASGKMDVDHYVLAREGHRERRATVLILEDDLQCANLLLRFFKRLKMHCVHVDTIAAACDVLSRHRGEFKLLLLDCFVRVENGEDRRTGAEWLLEFREQRSECFEGLKVVMITGHPEQLGEATQHLDLVLSKPWAPNALLKQLKYWSLVK
jgi:CheY-like chemotaxis protein